MTVGLVPLSLYLHLGAIFDLTAHHLYKTLTYIFSPVCWGQINLPLLYSNEESSICSLKPFRSTLFRRLPILIHFYYSSLTAHCYYILPKLPLLHPQNRKQFSVGIDIVIIFDLVPQLRRIFKFTLI